MRSYVTKTRHRASGSITPPRYIPCEEEGKIAVHRAAIIDEFKARGFPGLHSGEVTFLLMLRQKTTLLSERQVRGWKHICDKVSRMYRNLE